MSVAMTKGLGKPQTEPVGGDAGGGVGGLWGQSMRSCDEAPDDSVVYTFLR